MYLFVEMVGCGGEEGLTHKFNKTIRGTIAFFEM